MSRRKPWYITFIMATRAVTVGLAYYAVTDVPGLTSSFVAVFVALLPFDLIVAMPKFAIRWDYWKELFFILLPRISGTAITLGGGLALGLIFGGASALGLPIFLGTILTAGLGYVLGTETRGNISSYVGIIAGLSLFEQILQLSMIPDGDFALSIASTALRMIYGTFTALFAGWGVGVVSGVFTRAFLPRGFRSTKSAAYAQPLSMQSLKEVIRLDDTMSVMKVGVAENSPLAHKSLAESNLRSNYGVSVLSIFRQPKDVAAPKGTETIYPNDSLVVLLPTDFMQEFVELAKGSGKNEQV